jgi:hypothetical protein
MTNRVCFVFLKLTRRARASMTTLGGLSGLIALAIVACMSPSCGSNSSGSGLAGNGDSANGAGGASGTVLGSGGAAGGAQGCNTLLSLWADAQACPSEVRSCQGKSDCVALSCCLGSCPLVASPAEQRCVDDCFANYPAAAYTFVTMCACSLMDLLGGACIDEPSVGMPSLFSISPPSVDLGNLVVGTAAPKKAITVTAAVPLSDLTVSTGGAEFSIDEASTCTTVLAAGSSCTVLVGLTAASAGSKSGSIVIKSRDQVRTVPVTAKAQAPAQLVIAPANATFGASVGQTSPAVAFNVGNVGDVPTGSLNAAIGGTTPTDFAITSNNCTSLAPQAICIVSAVYRPTAASAASSSATLTVIDSDLGASPVSAGLNGTVK